jgi:hypothetical protein
MSPRPVPGESSEADEPGPAHGGPGTGQA